MTKDECYQVGQFIKPHGYKGKLSVKLDVDEPLAYKNLESVFVDLNNELIPFFFESFEFVKDGIFRVKLEGVDTEEEARSLAKNYCYLPLSFLPKLSGTKFYYHEIIGYTAIDSEYGEIGIIKQVLDGSAQPIFQISHSTNKEVLIPLIDDFILEVDRKAKTILLNSPEGLIEFYLSE